MLHQHVAPITNNGIINNNEKLIINEFINNDTITNQINTAQVQLFALYQKEHLLIMVY